MVTMVTSRSEQRGVVDVDGADVSGDGMFRVPTLSNGSNMGWTSIAAQP
jgi:hypothetical protein